jgi:hypothetical protein
MALHQQMDQVQSMECKLQVWFVVQPTVPVYKLLFTHLFSFLVSVNGAADCDHVASGAADENEGSGELNVDLSKKKN